MQEKGQEDRYPKKRKWWKEENIESQPEECGTKNKSNVVMVVHSFCGGAPQCIFLGGAGCVGFTPFE